MNNPFFGAMGGGNGFMQMVQQFKQFKANFQGDPKAEVEKLLQSGKLTQQQLNQLQQMAKNYDPKKYGARMFMEHIRGLSPDWGFRCMGDVIALRNGEIEIDGKKLLTLEAQLEPTAEFVTLTKKGQKIYSSIEIAPNFAGTNEAYLFGLGVTDSPASIGTEILQFAAQNPAASPFAARKQHKDNLFSEAVEVAIEFEEVEDDGPTLVERITQLFKSNRDTDSARFADIHAAVEDIAWRLSAYRDITDQRLLNMAAQQTQDYAATDQRLQEFGTRLDNTPEPAPRRSPATNTPADVLTDC